MGSEKRPFSKRRVTAALDAVSEVARRTGREDGDRDKFLFLQTRKRTLDFARVGPRAVQKL